MQVQIHPMHPSDWACVRAIYEEGLATGLATFEVNCPSWEQWDGAHLAHSRLVATAGGQVVAWAALAPVSARDCYRGVAEFSLYVAAAWRGQGIGTRLLNALVAESERNEIWTLCANTLAANTASLRLQETCGFRVVGARERIAQLDGVWQDTVLTERRSHHVGVEKANGDAPSQDRVNSAQDQ